MRPRSDAEPNRLDDAARAGWLYYVARNTQDEIAEKLGVSRQSAQRLVSLAVTEQLIKVRLDHPIARCMELAERVKQKFDLKVCEIVPSDPSAPFSMTGVAQTGAAQIERYLKNNDAQILAFGTGRSLRACVEQLKPIECPQHTIVSLLGNMMMDGSASAYNVIVRLSEKVNARHYPMPIPPLARTAAECEMFKKQEPVTNILALAERADATFVGIGDMSPTCPMLVDGFITHDEMNALLAAGSVGEITSWTYDNEGRLIKGLTNDRVTSTPLQIDSDKLVCGVAVGKEKVASIRAAMRGKLINGLISNEATSELLLKK